MNSYHIINVLPVVERDELEGGEHGPQQVVEAGVPVVRILSDTSQTHVPVGTRSKHRNDRIHSLSVR